MNRGQVFIVTAIAFSAIIIGSMVSSGPEFRRDTSPNTRDYFGQVLKENQKVFNSALENNLSAKGAKQAIYDYDRFVERRSLSKGITFKAYHLLTVPQKGKAVFINYFDSNLSVNFKAGSSWTNKTVEPNSSVEKTFKPGTVTLNLTVEETGTSHEFDAATPRILTHSRMDSSKETWIDTLLG